MTNAVVFVDANIIAYSRDGRDGWKQQVATTWMQQLWRQQSGRTSIQVLNEFYWTVTRKFRPAVAAEDAWVSVQMLMGWNPQPLDQPLLLQARAIEQRHRLSWWDALVVAAAQLQHCSILLTEDLQHDADFDGVRVCNPFVSQVQEAAAAYRAQVESRHRPRGRPRKRAA